MQNTMNVLFIGFPGIGDTLLSTPALRLLRSNMPNVRITALVTNSGSREVLGDNHDVDELIFVDKMWSKPLALIKTIRRLHQKKFDFVVTIYPTSRILSNVLAFCTGAPKRIVHDYPGDFFRKLSFLQNIQLPLQKEGHSVAQNINLLKPIGVKISPDTDIHLLLNITNKSVKLADDFLAANRIQPTKKLVGFHPGSGGMTYKRWPLENFFSLASTLIKRYDVNVIFFCGPNEKDILTTIPQKGFLVFEGSSILETAAVIRKCNLLITNDSSLMHVAVSQNVPVVAVFGPTDPRKTGPYTKNKIEVASKLNCSPCYDPAAHRRFNCIYGKSKCLEDVSVTQVYEGVKHILRTDDSSV